MMDEERKLQNAGQLSPYLSKRYYRVDEVAAYFSVSPRTIYRLIDEGEIRTLRIRDCIRISAEEVQAFEERMAVDDY